MMNINVPSLLNTTASGILVCPETLNEVFVNEAVLKSNGLVNSYLYTESELAPGTNINVPSLLNVTSWGALSCPDTLNEVFVNEAVLKSNPVVNVY